MLFNSYLINSFHRNELDHTKLVNVCNKIEVDVLSFSLVYFTIKLWKFWIDNVIFIEKFNSNRTHNAQVFGGFFCSIGGSVALLNYYFLTEELQICSNVTAYWVEASNVVRNQQIIKTNFTVNAVVCFFLLSTLERMTPTNRWIIEKNMNETVKQAVNCAHLRF